MAPNGGTLKFAITSKWDACTTCGEYFKKHYYVHQCLRIPHADCYSCMEKKGYCKRCGSKYVWIRKCNWQSWAMF